MEGWKEHHYQMVSLFVNYVNIIWYPECFTSLPACTVLETWLYSRPSEGQELTGSVSTECTWVARLWRVHWLEGYDLSTLTHQRSNWKAWCQTQPWRWWTSNISVMYTSGQVELKLPPRLHVRNLIVFIFFLCLRSYYFTVFHACHVSRKLVLSLD